MNTKISPYRGNPLNTSILHRLTIAAVLLGTVSVLPFDWISELGLLEVPVSKMLRALLLVIFIIFIVSTGLNFKKYDFVFGSVLAFYIVLNIFYALISEDILGNLYYASRIIYWILGTVVVFRLTLFGLMSVKALHLMIKITVLVGALFTIYLMQIHGAEAGQDASAYLLLWCLPILLIMDRSYSNNILLGLALLAIVLTVKRGAIIGFSLSIVAYYLTYLKLHNNNRAFIKVLTGAFLVAIIGYLVAATQWESIFIRFTDMSGSGRDRMYELLLAHWVNADILNIIFGFGINSVQQYTGIFYHGFINETGPFAHSDWLQLMHDYGLIGIGLLLWFHLVFIRLICSCYKSRYSVTPSLVMAYVILFLVNIYSGHLVRPNVIYMGILLAFVTAKVNLYEINKYKKTMITN